MKKVLAAASIAATIFAVSDVAASASTFNSTVDSTNHFNSKAGGQKGTFTDTYAFVLSQASDVYATFSGSGSLSNAISGVVSDVTFGIYNGTTEVLKGVIFKATPSLLGSTNEGILAAGSYTIKVSDTYAKASGIYNGNLVVSAVPLPGSVALFGLGIAALGVAGAVRRKSSKVAASI